MNPQIESELLKKHWNSVHEIYYLLNEKVNNNQNEIEFDELYDFLLIQWKKIYPSFVFSPIRNRVLNLFLKAQKADFKLKSSTNSNTKTYGVYYYLLQYFSLGVIPYEEYEDFPKIRLLSSETGSLNLILYDLFEEICLELGLESITNGELFDEREEFYQIELDLLSSFLSECWNEIKSQTNLNVKAVLFEATGGDAEYDLDNKIKIL